MKTVDAGVLAVSYLEDGDPDGWPAILSHGFPFDHGFGLAAGDPAYQELKERLARRPKIIVPAVTLDGASDTLKPDGTAGRAGMFTARHEHRVIDAGHNLPQEAPAAFADAVLTVRKWLRTDEHG